MPNDIGEGIREWADGDEAQLNGLALATSVRDALRARTGGFGTTFDRDAYYGLPSSPAQQLALQGREWFRSDTGWSERYYALYNAQSNPIGMSVAGWYPVSGNMPYLRLRGIGNTNIASSGSNWVSLTGLSAATSVINHGGWTVGNSSIGMPFPGRFSINADPTMSGNSGGGLRGYRFSLVNYGNLGQKIERWGGRTASGVQELINGRDLNTLSSFASNTLSIDLVQDSGATLVGSVGIVFAEYLGPASPL